MKRLLFYILCLYPVSMFAQLQVDGAYFYSPLSSTGLSGVYVARSDASVTLRYATASTDAIYWYRFTMAGTSSRAEIFGTQSGNVSTFTTTEKDCGFVVKQGNDSLCIWVASHRTVSGCEADAVQDNPCEEVLLTGEGFAIPYHTIHGQRHYLPRRVSYTTLAWDGASASIISDVPTQAEARVISDTDMSVPAPFGMTSFTVVDSIPLAWGEAVLSTTSNEYASPTILLQATAEQILRGAANEAAEQPSGAFGGSAPVEMTFTAYVSGDNYYAWEFSSDPEFSVVDAIYAEPRLAYSFEEEGTTYVRLHAYNDFCSRDTMFTISVGESKLEAPNVFSPHSSPGVNDEWKVAYKSIVEFKCWIFNRWGEQLYHYQDPAGGWDGRYRGRLVPPGVYYYVIEARGADGQEYKLKGHINILRSKNESLK